MDQTATIGFNKSAAAYEKGRPDYPKSIIDFLIREFSLGSSKRILDLAAGTGKFTRLIQRCGGEVIAIEPLEGMRKQFMLKVPDIKVMEGTAEQIPLPDASVDVVTVAQAFHWFSHEKALQEIHRVLKPDGSLVLIWNVRDESTEWIADLSKLIQAHESSTPQYRHGKWKDVFKKSALFRPLKLTQFKHSQTVNEQLVLDRVASISFVGAMEDVEREKLLDQVRQLVHEHPQLKGKCEFEFPHLTDVFIGVKNTVS